MLYRSDNIKMHRDFGFSQDNTNIYQIIYVEKNMNKEFISIINQTIKKWYRTRTDRLLTKTISKRRKATTYFVK